MDLFVEAIAAVRGGPTVGIAIATATAVAKLTIKQFLTIPLTGKEVAPRPMTAMPLFLFLCQGVAEAHALAEFLIALRTISLISSLFVPSGVMIISSE